MYVCASVNVLCLKRKKKKKNKCPGLKPGEILKDLTKFFTNSMSK